MFFRNKKIEADELRFVISVCAHAVPCHPNPCKQRTHVKNPTTKQTNKQTIHKNKAIKNLADFLARENKKEHTYAIMINKNCRGGGLWNMGGGVDESTSGFSRSRMGSPLTSMVSSGSWESWSWPRTSSPC